MRYVTPILVIALLGSLIANGVMYAKWRSHRAIFTVDGVGVSKLELEGYLEQTFGPQFKMLMTRRILLHNAAVKKGIAPTDAEVLEQYNQKKELDYNFARQVQYNPWLAEEQKRVIRETMEVNLLRTKDIPVTEDEIKQEYAANPISYDTPTKAHTETAIMLNEGATNDVMKMMSVQGKEVSPSIIMDTYRKDVVFLGNNYILTLVQHAGVNENAPIFNMKPNEVKELKPPEPLMQQGAKKMIVKLKDIVPGKKADINDKKTHDLIRMSVAGKRALPVSQVLGELWDNCKFESENPDDKRSITLQMFPERIRSEK